MIHDKSLIERRFRRSLDQYNTLAVVQREIADKLSSVIPNRSPRCGVEIGAGSGFLTRRLVEKFPSTTWIANDITTQSEKYLPPNIEFRAEDGETMELPNACDIIATASTVQWFDDLPRFISRTHKALNHNGVLAISTFGPSNFCEIKESLDYYTLDELRAIVTSKGYTIETSMEWTQSLTFDTPLEVLRHLKATGVNAITPTRWSPRQLQQFINDYPTPATLTFHPMIIIASKT